MVANKSLYSHLQNCAPFAFDRQLLFAELVADLPWAYDLQTGTLSFGDSYQWHAEILGTESEESGTWLWAWANEGSDIPKQQQGASLIRIFPNRLLDGLKRCPQLIAGGETPSVGFPIALLRSPN